VLGYLTTSKCISYIRFRPLFSGRRDDAPPFFEAARGQRDIGGNAHVRGLDAFGDPVVGCIRPVADENMLTFDIPGGRIGREPFETTKTLTLRRAATR